MQVAAVRPGGLDKIEIQVREDLVAGPAELLVRIWASSLNFHDFAVVAGSVPVEDGRIPMSDGAGEVIAVGEGVTDFKSGDRVVSLFFPNWDRGEPDPACMSGIPGEHVDGFAAELVAMPETAFTRIPDGYSMEEAATLPCAALTAWRGLVSKAKIKAGDWVLTQGTGGVSIFALQFAKASGCKVIATSSSDEKLAHLKELGADAVINYRETPDWGEKAQKITGGRGVDEVVEIGGAGTIAQSITACRIGGHISMIGLLDGFKGEVPTAQIFARSLRIDGITVGSRKEQHDMMRAIEASGIKPVISDRFPLSEIRQAFQHQSDHKHFGKIILSI